MNSLDAVAYQPVLVPDDQFNRSLVADVHPADWINPKPQPLYDLVVVGAGTAGLVTAAGAAGLGAKVALVERHLMGGDCLNVGCVPSKALISAARRIASVRDSRELGVQLDLDPTINFSFVMERLRRLRSEISHHDSAARFRSLGVDVFLGQGTFTSGGRSLRVGDAELRFKKAAICTGARASAPPIPGLADVKYLTNESLFSLTELPGSLAVIGGGPIGCEMAQAFARFGSDVTIYETGSRLLGRDDEDATAILATAFKRDHVDLRFQTTIKQISERSGKRVIESVTSGQLHTDSFDEILVAVGRAPNIEGLDLEAAGVEYDQRGVQVNDALRTSNPRIFAAGDICSPFKFTHAADFQARLLIRNALFFGRGRASDLLIPWATYTSPEVAHVGLTPQQAREKGIKINSFTQSLAQIDRAILEGETEGFARIHVKAGTDRIVGASVVSAYAGDLISQITLAMNNKVGLASIGSSIHPYPTQAEAIRKLGDQYNRTRLTPWTKWFLKTLIRLH